MFTSLIAALECKKKWNSLRDNFRKHLKKNKTTSGQAATKTKQWKHQEDLSFLIPFLAERAQRSNIETAVADEELPPDDDNSSINSAASSSTPFSETTFDSTRSQTSANSSSHAKRQLPPMAQVLENYLLSKKQKVEGRSDHLSKFFGAMEETVRSLKPRLQIEVKSKIAQLVTEYEIRNLEDEERTASVPDVPEFVTLSHIPSQQDDIPLTTVSTDQPTQVEVRPEYTLRVL